MVILFIWLRRELIFHSPQFWPRGGPRWKWIRFDSFRKSMQHRCWATAKTLLLKFGARKNNIHWRLLRWHTSERRFVITKCCYSSVLLCSPWLVASFNQTFGEEGSGKKDLKSDWENCLMNLMTTPPKTNMHTQNRHIWTDIYFKKNVVLGIYVRFRGG